MAGSRATSALPVGLQAAWREQDSGAQAPAQGCGHCGARGDPDAGGGACAQLAFGPGVGDLDPGKDTPHLENCCSLASMLRCLMHILVSAEPISPVPPGRQERQS